MTARPDDDLLLRMQHVHMRYQAQENVHRSVVRQLLPRRGTRTREVTALTDVSLGLHRGERLGVIGRNGSGKSTMVQIMAGLLPPTSGRVEASSLPIMLGIAAALDRGLSGRQNVRLGCLALGLSRADVNTIEDEVLAFAGVEDFSELPLRTYSAGMRARLQFAIATVVEPEILLIDEALGAGDRDFRQRSRDRIARLTEHAGAVVLVTHSMPELRRVCDRAIWIEGGRILMDGRPDAVVDAYEASPAAEPGP